MQAMAPESVVEQITQLLSDTNPQDKLWKRKPFFVKKKIAAGQSQPVDIASGSASKTILERSVFGRGGKASGNYSYIFENITISVPDEVAAADLAEFLEKTVIKFEVDNVEVVTVPLSQFHSESTNGRARVYRTGAVQLKANNSFQLSYEFGGALFTANALYPTIKIDAFELNHARARDAGIDIDSLIV